MRILGLLLIICSGALSGMYVCGRMKKRIELIGEVLFIMEMLDNHIMYSGFTLPECIARIKTGAVGATSKWLNSIHLSLINNDNNFKGAWTENLMILEEYGLKKSEIDVIKEYGIRLSGGNCDMLGKLHHIYTERLKYIYDALLKDYEKNSRLYRMLGIMGGLFIVVILF